jgi:hypothetical protein
MRLASVVHVELLNQVFELSPRLGQFLPHAPTLVARPVHGYDPSTVTAGWLGCGLPLSGPAALRARLDELCRIEGHGSRSFLHLAPARRYHRLPPLQERGNREWINEQKPARVVHAVAVALNG